MTLALVQLEAGSWSLSGAGQDAGWHWASAVNASLCTGKCWGISDADAHPCTGNTTTCCRVYTGSVQVSALNTLSSSSPFQCFQSGAVAFSAGGIEETRTSSLMPQQQKH